MYAVNGRLINVDLSSGELSPQDIPAELYREYLGGYGLGLPLLLERMDPACDALGPDNILGFASGYLTGTGALIGSRFMVFGKSPSSQGWGDANAGGFFGKALKNAGYDCILISGASTEPVYLLIEDGEAILHSAGELWGRDCYETEDMLKQKHGKDCQVTCIGPAGEQLSLIAGISNDKGRIAARSGLGAVMGSKMLKAVVVKGAKEIKLADPEAMKALRKKYLGILKDHPLAQGLNAFGTPMFLEPCLMGGDTPVKNWGGTHEDLKDAESLTAAKVKRYKQKPYGCQGCPIACGGWLKVDSGPYKTDAPVQKVEYETLGMMGANLCIEDIEAIIKLNDICNRMGQDTIGCGGLTAFAMECYENGIIGKEQTGGLELTWGNAEAAVELARQMGLGKGLGAVLAKGFEAAADEFGPDSRQYVMAVRNEGLPAHDPRWNAGLGLTYFTDATPARHTQGNTAFPPAGYGLPPFTNQDQSGRAPHQKRIADITHALNAAGLCLFGFAVLDYKCVPEFLEAAGGEAWSAGELETAGRRIGIVRHLFNLKAGVNFLEHKFPARVLGPLANGPTAGMTVKLDLMVKELMEEIGLDLNTAKPKEILLQELNLKQFV
jgi:aldehyde:ferredoxin oxidoreductase